MSQPQEYRYEPYNSRAEKSLEKEIEAIMDKVCLSVVVFFTIYVIAHIIVWACRGFVLV